MKKMLFPFLSLLFWACSTTMPAAMNPQDSYLMHVECVPGPTTRMDIIMLLRRARARDIRVDAMGSSLIIEAAYYKIDNSPGLLEDIADQIRQAGSVVDVELRDNPRVVRQTR